LNTKIPAFVLLCAACLSVGCLTGRPLKAGPEASSSSGEALGAFTLASQVLGSQSFTPTECASGDRQFFLGGDFKASDGGLVLRVVVDPLDGPVVRVFSSEAPYDKSLVFRRSECREFHFSLDETGWLINDVRDYRLSIQLDCSRPGESIQGRASATHCH
jgi:hypothetical protein